MCIFSVKRKASIAIFYALFTLACKNPLALLRPLCISYTFFRACSRVCIIQDKFGRRVLKIAKIYDTIKKYGREAPLKTKKERKVFNHG